jgi:hypothetical protein
MSFIYENKKLVETLVKEGEKFVQKYGQATEATQATVSPDAIATYELAKKLALGLQSNIEPSSVGKDAPINFVTNPNNPELSGLKPENVESLGDFLHWTAANKISWDGKRISWQKEEEIYDEDALVFETFPTNNKSIVRDNTRNPQKVDFYANKTALISFLSYLRDSDNAKKNKVLQVMLGGVIKQANQFLEKNEQMDNRPAQSATVQFNDDEIIDGFKDSILNPKSMYDGIQDYMPDFKNAPITLTYKDISSEANLKDWLRRMKVMGEDNKPYDIMSPESNPCPAIYVLYSRARYLAKTATDNLRPKFTALEAIYLKNITQYGRQFDYNGKACEVISPGASGIAGATRTPEAAKNKTQDAALRAMLSSLPLSAQDINFDRIHRFFENFRSVLQFEENSQITLSSNAEAAIRSMRDCESLMEKCSSLTTSGLRVINLNSDASTIANALHEGRIRQDYTQFLTGLDKIVDLVSAVVDAFYSLYENRIGNKSLLEAQTRGGYSYAVQNKYKISSLVDSRSQVFKIT